MKYEVFEDFRTLLENTPRRPRSIIDSSEYTKEKHWPSQLTSCRRQLYYDFTDRLDWNTTLHDEFTFSIGAAFEKKMGEIFKNANIYLGDEEPFTHKDERLRMPFSGRVDYVIDWEGQMIPVELKTTNHKNYKDSDYGTISFPGAGSKPKTQNFMQLNLYMMKMGVEWGILCYLNKNTGEYQFYKCYRSEEDYDKVVNHLKKLEEDIDNNVVSSKVYLDDDGEEFEIKDLAITTYKVSREGKFEKGQIRPDRYDKKNGKVGFPCIRFDKEVGHWKPCQYFERCWTDKLEELGLDITSINNEG